MHNHTTIIGRSHRLMQQNCHDFALTGSIPAGISYGLVLDGCGSKYKSPTSTCASHNEVGAKLLGQFMGQWLAQHAGNDQPLDTLFSQLHNDALVFLQTILTAMPFATAEAEQAFTMTHLLATVIGFVVREEDAGIFWAGDGYICLNGEVTYLDNDNQPEYLAYHLREQVNATSFQTQYLSRSDLHWLAVATDGWRPALLTQLSEPQPTFALPRWVNQQAKQRGNFEDDGAIALWWQEADHENDLD